MSEQLRATPAAAALGAFIENTSLLNVVESDAAYHALRQKILQYGVVFIREQDQDAALYGAFAERFGLVLDHPAYATVADAPNVQILESTPANPSKIEVWHSDMTFMSEPPSFTLLQGQIIPSVGGDTLWACAAASYANLSDPLQRLCDGLTAVHDFRHGFRESLAEPGGSERLADAIAENPPIEHPLVRTHPESGAKSLYVNALFTTRIPQLTHKESEALLSFLFRHIVTEEHTVRLQWQPGTVAIWDNRSVQHKPVNDFHPQHRRMHRVTICGDRPA